MMIKSPLTTALFYRPEYDGKKVGIFISFSKVVKTKLNNVGRKIKRHETASMQVKSIHYLQY
jgi:hypothetical protein